MKKNTIASLFMIILFMGSFVNQASAQAHTQGQLGLSASVGYNLISLIFSTVSSTTENLSSIPPISGAIDYGISDRFSLGLAGTYQSIGTDITVDAETFKANLTCVNVGIRPLFHLGSSDDLDFYAGIRVGTSIWSSTSESSDPNYDPVEDLNVLGSRIKLQPVVGIAYYFGEGALGINAEVATAPYLVAIGVKARL